MQKSNARGSEYLGSQCFVCLQEIQKERLFVAIVPTDLKSPPSISRSIYF